MTPPPTLSTAAKFQIPLASPLGFEQVGFRGTIQHIDTNQVKSNLSPDELETRLLEMGFIEGAAVEILHEGSFGRDPIAVRIGKSTIAIRRREAMAIQVK